MARKDVCTKMQEAFCQAFANSEELNGTQSALDAGSSPSSAPTQASKWLKMPKVQKRIAEILRPRLKRHDIKGDEVVQRLKTLAFAKLTDYIEFHADSITLKDIEAMPPELQAGLGEVSIRETKYGRHITVKMDNRLGALKVLAEYLKLIGADNIEDNRVQILVHGDAVIGPAAGKPRPDGVEIDVDGMLTG